MSHLLGNYFDDKLHDVFKKNQQIYLDSKQAFYAILLAVNQMIAIDVKFEY